MSGTFTIVGPDPGRVSSILGEQADRLWLAGEQKHFILPDGERRALPSVNENSGWKKFSPEELIEPEDVLRYWAEFVERRMEALAHLRVEASMVVSVLCQDNQLIEIGVE